ncbi:hypothetical protein BG015_008901 [Linnemannia schmuckeri]|uniref:Uncharacterized protein n=1 Tax=Linnemannia schmuckeri TaxID=64567 RepID=A0A9P5V9Z1_9FUNG|nr:hypothetical protein BG015_008901 [Linnemannia schmuckeri]
MSTKSRPCTFCFCSKGYLNKKNEDRSAQERAHCSSYHSLELTDLIYQDVLFRFRRDPQSEMKFRCLCDSELNSTQSLFNHVKGSSDNAAKKRKVCEKVVEVSNIVRRSRKPFRDTKDVESELFNAWPIEDAPNSQGSDCCVPVVYDPLTQEDEATPYPDDSLKDVMLATLRALDEIKERMASLESQQRSCEASLVDLKSQVSVMAQAVSSLITSRSN